MFLPTVAVTLLQELDMPIKPLEPMLILLDQADTAMRDLGVEKKIQVHVVYTYHSIRLERCWKWLLECYADSAGSVFITTFIQMPFVLINLLQRWELRK